MPGGELAALTEVAAVPVTGRVVPHFPLDGRGKARIGQELPFVSAYLMAS